MMLSKFRVIARNELFKATRALQEREKIQLPAFQEDSFKKIEANFVFKHQNRFEVCIMDASEFRKRGYEMVDYIADYHKNIRQYRVTPEVEPGFLFDKIPLIAPEDPEPWENIMNDLNGLIMPGMTHWQHPNFHAYFPVGTSYPSILGDMFAAGTSNMGFSWASDPASSEMEIVIIEWLAKMLGLPDNFVFLNTKSKGGGCIQNSASECILVALLAARYKMMVTLKKAYPTIDEGVLLAKLVAYCSSETHSCAEKAAMIAFVKIRVMDVDDKLKLRGETLSNAIQLDRRRGLVPFFVVSTCGSTSACAFDRVDEIGMVCKRENIWMHVDASYAGTAMVCPEFRYLFKGVELAESFNFNPAKWMLTTFDTTVMWVTDRTAVTQSLVVNPAYLKHEYAGKCEDFRNWEIPLGRKCRAIKLWFIIRNYGITGIQEHVRQHVRMLKMFESLMRKDARFEIVNEVVMGLVSFRLRGSDLLNEELLSSINQSGLLHMVPATLFGKYVMRFGVNYEKSTERDMHHAWNVVSTFATSVLLSFVDIPPEEQMSESDRQSVKDTVIVPSAEEERWVRNPRSVFARMTSDFNNFQSDVTTYPTV